MESVRLMKEGVFVSGNRKVTFAHIERTQHVAIVSRLDDTGYRQQGTG